MYFLPIAHPTYDDTCSDSEFSANLLNAVRPQTERLAKTSEHLALIITQPHSKPFALLHAPAL